MRVLVILLLLFSACVPHQKPIVSQVICKNRFETIMGCCFKVEEIKYGLRCWISPIEFYDIEHAKCKVYSVMEHEFIKRCHPK